MAGRSVNHVSHVTSPSGVAVDLVVMAALADSHPRISLEQVSSTTFTVMGLCCWCYAA